jgi:alpha-D-ribose 1-methylphosphonate 5-triphosphate synthase subunit PhnH
MNIRSKAVSLLAQVVLLICASPALAQTPSSVPIPPSLFGNHLINDLDWPTVPFAALGKGTGVAWSAIEPTKGSYNWARLDERVDTASSHGVSIFYAGGGVPPWAAADTSTCHSGVWGPYCTSTVANMQDWVDFMTELVSRYKGRIQVYELWNEPQNSFTGTYAELVALTQQEYNIIRSIDPSATILSPSMVSYGYAYLDNYFAAGGTRGIDAVAIHTYPNPTNDIAEVVTGSMTTTIKTVMSKYGLSGKPLWDTEGSWGNTSSGAITDPDLRTAFVARSYLLHWSIGITRFYWYAWDSQAWGNLWSSTSGPSEAAIAYGQVYNWMNGATMALPCSLNGATSAYHAVITCDLTRSGGYQARAVWNTDGSSTYTVPNQYTQYRDLQGYIYSIPSDHQVTIGHKPILLEGTTVTVNNPILALTSLNPSSKTAGDAGFTLTVNGSGFVNGAIVSWNGSGRARAFVNSTTMTAAISASDIANAGTANVTVTNPAPGETTVYSGCKCTTSNYLTFTINQATPAAHNPVLTSLTPSSKTAGNAGFTLTVNGSGFVNGAIVSWNGSGRARAFVNSTTMTAAISASDIANAGTAKVTVTNPAPGETRTYPGCKCATSNYLSFTINP